MNQFKLRQALQAALLLEEGISMFELMSKYGLSAESINLGKKILKLCEDGN
jgi:hypothetical protein